MNFHLIRDDLSSKSVPFYDVTKNDAALKLDDQKMKIR